MYVENSSLLMEVCSSITREPLLQQLSGAELSGASANSDDGACMDIAGNCSWGMRRERAFLDTEVSNPYAPSNRESSLPATYKTHEREKK